MIRFTFIIILTALFACNRQKQQKTVHNTKSGKQINHQVPASKASALGHQQSPINIPSQHRCKAHKHLVNFHYKPSNEKVVNTGHTIRLDYDKGSTITYDKKDYELKQFHFHTPAEHHLQGVIYPMEMHMVHQTPAGDYLVIGLMFKEGKPNPTLATILHTAPQHQGVVQSKHLVDASQMLPSSQHFYTYQGSFTTPPYTEGVRWLIFQEIVEASPEQIAAFKKLEGNNVRDNQELFSRVIEQF